MAAERTAPARDSEQAIAAALQRYRVMANVVGVLLIALIVVAVPLKYFGGHARRRSPSSAPRTAGCTPSSSCPPSTWRCARSGPSRASVLTVLAGTVPFLSFFAERTRHPARCAPASASDHRGAPALPPPDSRGPAPDVWPARLLLHRRRPRRRRHRRRGARGPALPAPPRPRRERGLVGRPGGVRLQPAVVHRHRAQPPADALRRRPLPDRLQRRDLQLRGAARPSWPPRARRSPPRATPRRSSPATTCGARTSSTGCAACSPSSSGTPRRRRSSAPATPSASSRCSPPAWPTAAIVFSSEKKALLELLGGSKAAGGVDAASLQHYLTLQYVPEPATLHRGIRRIESGTSFTVVDGELTHDALLPPDLPDPAGREGRAAGALRPDRRRPRRLGARCTCGPTSRSARSSPAASTPPPSPRWPSATTRSC